MQMTIDQGLLQNIVVALVAIAGLRRGANREIVMLAGVLLALFVAPKGGPALPRVLNFGRSAVSGLVGRGEAASAAIGYSGVMDLLLFGFLYLLFLLIARLLAKPPKGFSSRFLGGLLGGAEGYVIARFAFSRLFGAEGTTLVISGSQAQATGFSPANMAAGVVVLIIVLIGLGIRQSAPSRPKKSS